MGLWGKDLNYDQSVIDDFGHEWAQFGYLKEDSEKALDLQFSAYCSPIDLLLFKEKNAIAADFGAGSGRWTSRFLPYFKNVYALEPSHGANSVLQTKFRTEPRVTILQETVGENSILDESLDLAISLGVLHHIPDTGLAIKDISQKIKKGGYFLCYLYYKLEDKPLLYRTIFNVADRLRRRISVMSPKQKKIFTNWIAVLVYWPISRFSRLVSSFGIDVDNFPLHQYAGMPFKMLANDSLDRFGTTLEQRFNKEEIAEMLRKAGFDLSTLIFSEFEPFWTFSVKKSGLKDK
jgi:SAM-dependent methyltransferase